MPQDSRTLPEYLTVKEICEAMKLSKHTVYRKIESGELEAKRFGRSVRITRESFDRYIANS